MLEQFHPSEAVELTALAEQHGFSGCMAADHFQPWVPAQGQASFVWNVLTAVGERTTGDIGPGRHLPVVPVPPGDGRPGRRDARGDVPGPALARASAPARRSTSTSIGGYWPEAGERIARHVRGDRDHQEALRRLDRRQGRQAPGHATSPWRRPGCGRCPTVAPAGARRHRRADQRQAHRQVRRRHHHRRRAAGEDRRAVRQVRRGRARGRQGPRHDAEGAAAAPVVGARPTSRRWPTR